MYEIIFLWALALIWIIFTIVQDFKTREIANWLNFSLAAFALSFRFFYSLFNNDGFNFFYQGVIGLGIFFALGNLFYYSRVFAGGDAKLLISLGAVLPYSSELIYNLKDFVVFIFSFLIIGSLYVLIASSIISFKNFKKFKKEFLFNLKKNKKYLIFVNILGIIFSLMFFLEEMFLFFGLFFILIFWLYLYSISIEKACMIKKINPKKLREGDWLYKDVFVFGKKIKAKWDGLVKKEISLLVKKGKLVEIKEGVPFSPTFLIALLLFIGIKIFNVNLGYPFW